MAFPYKRLTEEDVNYICQITSKDRVYVGEDINEDYYTDEMPEYGAYAPEILVDAISTEEVSKIMAYAYQENIPVVCRGAGTGLAGGAICKYGGIMLNIMRMNKIDPIDRGNLTITTQPGALLSEIQEAAKKEGLYYPPDPGERNSSIGGNVATNAGGMKAVRYGLTKDFVRCFEAVLPDGSIEQFSSNVVKNTTGYNLKDLIIGSEGTLAIITEITLKLLPAPKESATLIIPFHSLEECAEMVPKLISLSSTPTPTAIEFLEQELLEIVERTLNKKLPVLTGDAVLIVMYDTSSKEEMDICIQAVAEEAMKNGAIDVFVADTPQSQAQVWDVRGSILEGMKADSVSQEECDIVVPRDKIAEYVREARNITNRLGLRMEPCGHCGDGNIHTEILRGPNISDQEWGFSTGTAIRELYALAKRLNGQMSGEHGIGNGRIEYLEEFVGPRMINLYKAVKLAFDDKLILNPGKIVEFNENRKRG